VGNNDAQSVLEIARLMAAGELAFRQGNRDHAFTLLHQAVAKEESLQYDEPPGWMQPVRHALGALLLADGKAAQAEAVYQADLVRHPNNAWALLGLQQALQAQGKIKEAEAVAGAVTKAWERADVVPVASCYCHPDALSQATASASQDN
jgi:tetratricopeptide (TPR) repeat protein